MTHYGESPGGLPPSGQPGGKSFTIVRQHKLLASETSIWPRLTASNAVNYHILHEAKTCSSADLCTHDNNRHGAHTGSVLIT